MTVAMEATSTNGYALPILYVCVWRFVFQMSIRIVPKGQWYDYNAKYIAEDTQYLCPGLDGDDEGEIRRIALAAQGFGRPRPSGAVTMRHVQQVIDRVGQFQIDSVNVAVRAHYMPLFSRLGAYDRGLLDRAAGRGPRRLFEYWAHAACLVDVQLQPALRMAMRRRADRERTALDRILKAKPQLLDRVLDDVSGNGPLSARQIENDEVRSRVDWGWNW